MYMYNIDYYYIREPVSVPEGNEENNIFALISCRGVYLSPFALEHATTRKTAGTVKV